MKYYIVLNDLYQPTENQLRTALKKPDRKFHFWTPNLVRLLIALGLMVGGIFGFLWIITND